MVNVSVDPGIGAVDLLHQCLSSIHGRWLEWSGGYNLREDVTHLECKGVPITGEKDCILLFFAKKLRSRVSATGAVRQYDFAAILDINLVIKSSFHELACEHRDQAFQAEGNSIHKVSRVADCSRLILMV